MRETCGVKAARASFFLLVIIYLGYTSLGLPDGTLGVAWPPLHSELGLPIGMAGTIVIVATLLTGLSGFSSGRIIARWKTGPVVLVSCVLTGGALMLISQAQGLAWLLVAAVPLGLGAGAVDAGLNGYVARHYSGRHMNWLHACWGIGATGGPLIMAAALAGGNGGWRHGYLAIGSVQLSLAAIFLLTLGWWSRVPERTAAAAAAEYHGEGRIPTLGANSSAGWLSATIFAVYVAVEMTAGVWAGSILVVARGFSQETAGVCTAAYYAAITGGRILVGFVVERFGNRRSIVAGMLFALAGAVLFAFAGTPLVAGGALVLLGLGFAPVYPCLMHEVPRRFAPEAVQTVIGRQSGAASLGAAFLPAVAGWQAGWSLESVAWTVIAGVLVLAGCIRKLDRMT